MELGREEEWKTRISRIGEESYISHANDRTTVLFESARHSFSYWPYPNTLYPRYQFVRFPESKFIEHPNATFVIRMHIRPDINLCGLLSMAHII